MNHTTTLTAGNTPARKAYRRPATKVVKLGTTTTVLAGSINQSMQVTSPWTTNTEEVWE